MLPLGAKPNKRLERIRRERASLVSCVGEPLKRSVSRTRPGMFATTRKLMASTLLIVGTALVSVVAQSGTAPRSQGSFVLERGRAGQFELGMTVDETYRLVGREYVHLVASLPEGMFQPELQIQLPGFPGGPALTATIREWPCGEFALWGILVHDSRFRTSNGLGVGSTLGDLKRQYRAARVTGIDTDSGPVVVVSELGLTFRMKPARSFTDMSRVSSVWVFPQPDDVRARRCPERPR